MIDLGMAVEAVKKAVEVRGEGYVYPNHYSSQMAREAGSDGSCKYWWGDKQFLTEGEGDDTLPEGPGCIVGVALHSLGWPAERLAKLDIHGTIRTCWDRNQIGQDEMSEDALDFFAYVQAEQDGKRTWGYALDAGLARMPKWGVRV